MVKRFVLVAAISASVSAAHAYPTALGVIPVANILRHREAAFYYAITGVEQRVTKQWFHSAGVQVGAFDRVEFGVDTNFLGQNVGNAKVLIFDNPKFAKNLTLAVGAMNVQQGNWDP